MSRTPRTLADRRALIDATASAVARVTTNLDGPAIAEATAEILARSHGLTVTPAEVLQVLAEEAGFVE